jgi:hypothetical protein
MKRLADSKHADFVPWNIIIQGTKLELIDWDGGRLPPNYELCLSIYQGKA